jgi:16S rRNA (guanine527-N7)-methyltransferase
MHFSRELESALPPDVPNRSRLITIAARHLQLIADVNEHMNLTRITGPREAVIKHIVDSVTPWPLFQNAATVMDAGTGAGFPGIPLAVVLPDTRFVLVDSTQKKARFVETALADLALDNVEVVAERAEDVLRQSRFTLITARAVAPVERSLAFFAAGLKNGTSVLMYKGPDVEHELKEADTEAKRRRVKMDVVMRYELPDSLGARTIVRISSK